MVVEYIRYRIDPARAETFEAAYAAAGEVLAADPRCLAHEVSRGEEEPDRYVVRIEWTSTRDHLEGFRRSAAFPTFLASVRPYLADLEEMAHYHVRSGSRRETADDVPTLFTWAGGAPAFARLVDAFYDRVETDDLLGPLFLGGVSAAHREAVTTWWVEVFGGPAGYSDVGGYPRMLQHHLDLAITGEQRFRFASLMSRAADDAGLPDDPEFRAAFVGYVEWGTRLAWSNSQPGSDVVRAAPVPRWGWGVAPPYRP